MMPVEEFERELNERREQGLYVTIRKIGSPQGAWIIVDGKKVLNLSSNNYLGFANHPRLKEAAKKGIDDYGAGPAAVRTIAGDQLPQEKLEEMLAEFKGAEAAVLYQSGFCANLGTIPALVGEGDAIFSDELNHASIIDGCRLSRAKIIRYPHLNVQTLEELLKQERQNYKKAMIITDGVFSMDGDIAPMDKLADLADKYQCILYVDDAHGEGVLGDSGRGIVDYFGLQGRVDVEIGTLSKAFGVVGGFAAGSKLLAELLKQKARPLLFSSAPTAADVYASMEAVRILQESDELVKKLWENANYFKEHMRKAGFDLGNSQTPITPVMIGDEITTQEFSKKLFERNVFAQAISYPTVPKGKARMRVMISATHSRDDLDFAVEQFTAVGKELGVIQS
ncbi:MAG TPA: glycine C-acetyltransferase [Coprothermobacter proteolyticus]|nr:glycine C-acetyltransferase [Coprothermobacter proteolyticus]MBK6585818.1 glycine C-acetyltransferase [Coprothermobacter sp.]ACI18052.1 2-amino-3-ketobutyrate CoA ligase [Coprothermobacter proteolyticus DSM 5265]MBP8983264.1 glycine C-acetyltransferase [Coprothermobacter sp.]NLT83180.1 glycine C-acetyltransferase [Coprothermobacter proteolyticus]HOA64525.1 glycine C-acetyltransferase [Coprothermobacter proteolyticus]